MSTTLITSRDPKGLQFMSIVEAAYNKAKLDGDGAQLLNERGDELKAGVSELITKLSVPNQFAEEEVESSSSGYHSGYRKPKNLPKQIAIRKKHFPELGECHFSLDDKMLPDGAEGYFVIPRWQKLGKTYVEALQRVLDELSEVYGRGFKNWHEGELGPTNLRQSPKSAAMWEKIGQEQKGDILVVTAQFGIRHRGRSIRRAREVMRQAEFGLGAFAVGVMLLTHKNRLKHHEDLWIDCAGDEFHDPQFSHAPFDHAPCFIHNGGQVQFIMRESGHFRYDCGSASAWAVPQV